MSKIIIEESKMNFELEEDEFFYIEKSEVYESVKNNVKMVEFVNLHRDSLIFIEAKKSAPNPENPDSTQKFEDFISDIYEKFLNGLILFFGVKVGRPYIKVSALPTAILSIDWKSVKIRFFLIIKDHKEAWLSPINDEINLRFRAVMKCFAITSVLVINDQIAKTKNLIV